PGVHRTAGRFRRLDGRRRHPPGRRTARARRVHRRARSAFRSARPLSQRPLRNLRPPMTTLSPPAPLHESVTWTAAPFEPRRGLRNGHVMTVYAWAARRLFPGLEAPEARLIRVSDDTQVLAHCYWQRDRQACPTLLALH